MLPLVTHASTEDEGETASLVDIHDDFEEDDEEEDLELEHPGDDTGQEVRIANSHPGSGANSRSTRVSQPELLHQLKPGQIVKTREFWILWTTFFLNTQAIGYINSMYKAYGQVFIKDDHFLAVVGAFAAIFNASGRVFWGHLCDKFGYRSCMVVVTIAMALLYLTFGFAPVYGGKALFAMWVWAIFFFFCANFVLLPTATAQTFGVRYVANNTIIILGSIFGNLKCCEV
jgi:nitrate/nitrite transporter NarK